jgi:hypothetical protein
MLSGKFMIGSAIILPKLMRLALFTGLLSILYFFFLDGLCRMMGLDPGRFEEQIT